jgi:hypothetical protein
VAISNLPSLILCLASNSLTQIPRPSRTIQMISQKKLHTLIRTAYVQYHPCLSWIFTHACGCLAGQNRRQIWITLVWGKTMWKVAVQIDLITHEKDARPVIMGDIPADIRMHHVLYVIQDDFSRTCLLPSFRITKVLGKNCLLDSYISYTCTNMLLFECNFYAISMSQQI